MKKLMTIAVITATAALTSCSTYDVEYDVSLSAIERVEILETLSRQIGFIVKLFSILKWKTKLTER